LRFTDVSFSGGLTVYSNLFLREKGIVIEKGKRRKCSQNKNNSPGVFSLVYQAIPTALSAANIRRLLTENKIMVYAQTIKQC